MKVYLIRHGRTDCNERRIFNGRIEEDINENGIRDAEKARDQMRNADIDVVYCSPQLRTRHTCSIINEAHWPVIYDDRLKERTLGSFDGKCLRDEGIDVRTQHLNYYFHYPAEGAEDLPVLFARVKGFLDELKVKEAGKNVLIVSHGGVIRAMHYYFTGLPADGDWTIFTAANGQILEYEL